MDYSPRIQRQGSCRCGSFRIRSNYEELDQFSDVSPPPARGNKLCGLWRKIVREKRRILRKPGNAVLVPYDPYSYAQNFDDGPTWEEPDNLSRSFSARFAVPARVLEEIQVN
ncbi:hypothetical protein LUZ63_016807 [Rhynchospora breviuscula]|uniref:Uncharacterized protein n=1 Tax=Rhynchospora breviuscula TaxID=2022672 RepID=A0A9P9ZAL9_9POAL|nr:hypothetical protein LUZ63_016807 [Rhynchospora breviuscula]